MSEIIKRGDIYYADLGEGKGSEQGGSRPVLVIQNNIGNKFSPTVIVAAITSSNGKTNIPTHVELNSNCGLPKNSIVLLEQIRTIDKRRLSDKIGRLDSRTMDYIDRSSKISLGLEDIKFNEYYIYERINEIKKLDKIINNYSDNDFLLDIEELRRIRLMGEIISYCDIFSIDCKKYLQELQSMPLAV